jgi:peptidoglycan/LPS O-acetylase OafA/YrhL
MNSTLQPRIQIHSYAWLDLMRGMAAMEVFLSHSRTLFFKGYNFGDPSIVKTVFYLLTGFSHQSVIVFFVLSGFFISRTVYNSANAGKFTVRNYLIDRFVRLWVVLIPALVLTFILDKWGSHLFGGSPAYQGTIPFIGSPDQLQHLGLGDFFGNVFFLQNFLVKPFGTNTPLWSLCNEFWYYILFPLVYFAVVNRAVLLKIILSMVAIGIMLFVGKDITLYFLVWMMGFALVLLQEKFRNPSKIIIRAVLLSAVVLISILLYYTRNSGASDWITDSIMGLLTSAVVFCALNLRFPEGYIKRTVSFLSEISYSLYVIHLPLAIFISSWLIWSPRTWDYHFFAIYIGVMAGILGITILSWFLFESRYKQLRSAVKAHHFFRSSHA